MGHQFAQIAFTDSVRQVQNKLGSRAAYAQMDAGEARNHILGQREMQFIAARDSFYMASVSETGWPYVQHRGGAAGFMRIVDEQTLGFADFSGNRQYVSVGNFNKDNRVSLFFMDYVNKTRLKLLGRVRQIDADDPALQKLAVSDYPARIERGLLIDIEAFDWNCPQHITPRFTQAEVNQLIAPVPGENQQLKENAVATTSDAAGPTKVLGDGPVELVVSGVRQLTPRIRSFELRDPQGKNLPSFEAGAHLKIPVRLANGELTTRDYSIASSANERDHYDIAVQRESEGEGGSNAVHHSYVLGLRIRVEHAQNNFHLHDDERPAVLIAGGIGITPIKSMADTLKTRDGDLQFHYMASDTQAIAFRRELQNNFGDHLQLYSSADNERIDLEKVLGNAAGDAIFYICGPARLIDAVMSVAEKLNIDATRIRFERFSAALPVDAKPVRVELRRSAKSIEVSAQQSILDAILDAGVDAPFSCKAGNCRSCAVEVLSGEPEHRDSALSTAERVDGGLFCPCVSRAKSEHLVLDI